jgi:hypothetical protein
MIYTLRHGAHVNTFSTCHAGGHAHPHLADTGEK